MPPPLDAQVRQQVEVCSERLRTDLGRWLALLTHDSGTLVAWTGPGDPAAMAHYCRPPPTIIEGGIHWMVRR